MAIIPKGEMKVTELVIPGSHGLCRANVGQELTFPLLMFPIHQTIAQINYFIGVHF